MIDITGRSDRRIKYQNILSIFCIIFLILWIVVIYRSGIKSAINLWIHSSVYNYCFLIVPIFLYMLWADRDELAGVAPQPTPWGWGVIAVFSALWGISFLAGIAEGVQFAIVGLIQGVLLTVLGVRLYVRLLLPFCYLWLLVPSGEVLVPTLQMATAKWAAWLLDLVGIETFRDGIVIEVSSGAYRVSPGCAGLNFVLAALAISVAYAHLIYRSWQRRLMFVAAMLAMAVVGNALRVFLIIAIAHVTNNIGNIADDHLLYGWAFFSVLLLGAMAVGQRFRQDQRPVETSRPPAHAVRTGFLLKMTAFTASFVAVVPMAIGLFWPNVAHGIVAISPLSCAGWDADQPILGWPTSIKQVDALASIDCRREGRHMHFAVALFDRPVRDGKVFGVERWVAASQDWSRVERSQTRLSFAGHHIPVQVDTEAWKGRRRQIWSMFWIDNEWREPGLSAAIADMKAEAKGSRRAVLVLAATEVDEDDRASADLALSSFLSAQPLENLTDDRLSQTTERGH